MQRLAALSVLFLPTAAFAVQEGGAEAAYRAAIADAARAADETGFPRDAAALRDRLAPPDPLRITWSPPPDTLRGPVPRDLPSAVFLWRSALRNAEGAVAADRYARARDAARDGDAGESMRLLDAALAADPDHGPTRKVLGFTRSGDRWETAFDRAQARRGLVRHPTFGWMPERNVANYEAGERLYRGRWVPAEQEAEFRRDLRKAWVVVTEHYRVRTNHSLERGVRIAEALEGYRDFLRHLFPDFFVTADELRRGFAGRPTFRPAAPHEVHYYRTKEEYVRLLRSKIPQIAITDGLYFTGDRVAYFYHDDAVTEDRRLFHEATHQLFYESLPTDRLVGEETNFWFVEGIACYLESFRETDGAAGPIYEVGDPGDVRVYAARVRLTRDRFYVPLRQLTGMSRIEIQADPNLIGRLYSQSSGLCHFLMHGGGGEYRDEVGDLLAALYHRPPRDRRPVPTFADLTGLPFEELDRRYAEHVALLNAAGE